MLDKHIVDFNENLSGLREFVELIDPFLSERIKEHNEHLSPFIVSAYVNDILSSDKEDWEEGEKERYELIKESVEKEIKEKWSEMPEVFIEKKVINGEENKYSFRIKGADDDVSKRVDDANKAIQHIELLYTNALISSLSSVEWFFSQILHFYYDKHPESAGIQKRTLTLADLKTFDSIEAAEKNLIDVKIEEILRGNFESWITLLKSELGMSLSYIDELLDQLVEIYQRRNLFVHNGGIVNSIYLSKTKIDQRIGIKNGEKLTVNKQYLDSTICILQKAFILIGAELWKKLDPNDETRGEVLGEITYQNLMSSRWEIAKGLSYFTLKDAKSNPIDKVVAQLNYWLCEKELGNFNTIQKELMSTDYGDKKEIFQLGLFALQNKVKEFFEILPDALETNQINIERLEEFPILREIRETEEYQHFKTESKYFKDSNQEVEKVNSVNKD